MAFKAVEAYYGKALYQQTFVYDVLSWMHDEDTISGAHAISLVHSKVLAGSNFIRVLFRLIVRNRLATDDHP